LEAPVRGAPIREEKNGGGGQAVTGPNKRQTGCRRGDQRLRETVGDCEPDRLERERGLLALLSQVVLWECASKDAIGLRTNDRCE